MDMLAGSASSGLTVGGRTFKSVNSSLIHLIGITPVTNHISTGRRVGANAGYQVPAGKILRIGAIRVNYSTTGAAAVGILFGYGDNDVGQANGAVLPANPVYYPTINSFYLFIQTAIGKFEYGCNFEIPAGKYFFVNGGSVNTTITEVFGTLEDA